MPQSRKRAGHSYHKEAAIPAKQRVKGRVLWAILFGVFGLLFAWFAAGSNSIGLITGTAIGALIGYIIGKKMEKDAT